jgi:signal transduction histidine kinase
MIDDTLTYLSKDMAAEKHLNAVRISVADDGPGLPVSLRTRVLEPFFKVDTARTSTDRTGFGLGLSIVDDIVRAHGGKIELLNAIPHGLIAQIDLPAEDASSVVPMPHLKSNPSRGVA